MNRFLSFKRNRKSVLVRVDSTVQAELKMARLTHKVRVEWYMWRGTTRTERQAGEGVCTAYA